MKKLFTLFAAMMTLVAINATKVTFDFSSASAFGYANPEAGAFTQVNNGDVLTKDGVTITVSFASGNGVRFFANTNSGVINLREYVGSTLTISAPAGSTINAINLDGSNLTSTYLSGDITSKEWTGDASTITMNITKSTVQINSMVVTLDETPVITPVDTIGVSEAVKRIEEGKTGKCYVMGRIVSIDDSKIAQYSNLNCWMVDIANEKDTLEGYKMNGANNMAYKSAEEVEYAVGDTVIFYASALQKYNTTYEINEGYFVELVGGKGAVEKVTISFNEAKVSTTKESITFDLKGEKASLYIDEWEVSNAQALKAMAGSYAISEENAFELTVDGNKVNLVKGTLKVAFVSMSEDGSENTYTFSLYATSDDNKIYSSEDQIVAKSKTDFSNDNTNIDCEVAAAIAAELDDKASTEVTYKIYGYYTKFAGKYAWDSNYKTQTFWMNDDPNASKGTFEVYQGSIGKTEADTVVKGDFVCVTSKIYRYNTTYETTKPTTIEKIDPAKAPVIRHAPVTKVTVAEALTVGKALDANTTSSEKYEITAYVISAYEPDSISGEQTWYMADEEGETNKDNELMIQFTKADKEVVAGDVVKVTGFVMNYVSKDGSKSYICIRNANAKVIEETPVQNITETVKVTKTILNGRIIILRGDKTYTIDGRQF